MNKGRRNLAFTLVLFFMITVILPVYADELDDHQNRLNNVSREIDKTRSQVNNAKQKERTIMGQIQSLENDISATQAQLNSTADRIALLEQGINKTEKEIEKAEKELQKKSDILSERLVFVYEQGDISYLEVLLAATDIQDFLTRYDMVNSIVEQDVELIEAVNEQKHDLEMKKSSLEVKKKEMEKIQASQENLKDSLAGQQQEKKQLLSGVQQEKAQLERALKELEQASRELESIISRLQAGSTTPLGTGIYTWPAPGYSRITSEYGMRYHPILKQRKLHTGVDIGAPSGANIVAADAGTVIYSGWMNGYGQVVVIDHGQGISTLYAHQSTILAGKGTSVTKGQIIGKVGSTGWSTGPHLHFEVRINGSPTNPMQYIR